MKVQETRWGGDDAVFRRSLLTGIFLSARPHVIRILLHFSSTNSEKDTS